MTERILMTGLDTEHAHFREDSCEESFLLKNYLEKRIERAETFVKVMRKNFGKGEQCQGFPLTEEEQKALHPYRVEEEEDEEEEEYACTAAKNESTSERK